MTIKKQNPNFVLIVELTSQTGRVDPVKLSNYAYLQIVDPLKRLPGVGDVQIFGERRYSMRVWLDPDRLSKLGITATDVQGAIAEQNIQVAAGKIGQSPAPVGTAFEMQVERGRPTVHPGGVRQHRDTGRSRERVGRAVARCGADRARRPAIRLHGVLRGQARGRARCLPAARVQTRSSFQSDVTTTMEKLKARFPAGIDYGMHYDTTKFVSASMHDVVITLAEALILVVLVVYIFLQSWRTTIIRRSRSPCR